jgi:small nuclear ribonucleoprotein (snRNP)-like protein
MEGLKEMVGKRIRVKTTTDIYRGTCEAVDEKTFSVLLKEVEKLKVYGRPSEEEWEGMSAKMFVHGNRIEIICLD